MDVTVFRRLEGAASDARRFAAGSRRSRAESLRFSAMAEEACWVEARLDRRNSLREEKVPAKNGNNYAYFSHVKIFALQLLLRNALGPSKLGLEVHKHMLCILCTAHLGFNFRILATCVAIDNVLLSP